MNILNDEKYKLVNLSACQERLVFIHYYIVLQIKPTMTRRLDGISNRNKRLGKITSD